jgi:hypothetical protein
VLIVKLVAPDAGLLRIRLELGSKATLDREYQQLRAWATA